MVPKFWSQKFRMELPVTMEEKARWKCQVTIWIYKSEVVRSPEIRGLH